MNPHPAPLLRVCPRDFVGLCAIPAPTCHYESYGSTKYMILNYLTGEPGGTRTRDPVIKSQFGRVLQCVENTRYPIDWQRDTRILSYSGILGFTLIFCVASPKFQ